MSSPRSAVRSGCSPSRVSLPVFPLTESGSPTVWRNRPVSRSMWPRPRVGLRRRWLRGSIWPRPRCGRLTAAIYSFGASATGRLRLRTTSIGTWHRWQADRLWEHKREVSCFEKGFRRFVGYRHLAGGSEREAVSSFMRASATHQTRGRWLLLPRRGTSAWRRSV